MMETITFKVDHTFAQEMERVMHHNHYTTKTEFIRDAIRDKLHKFEAIQHLYKIAGSAKRKTSDKERHEAGERAFEEISRRLS